MKLEFKINKYYLAGYAMASKNKLFPAWEKLKKRIWQKYKNEPAYYFLNPMHINWTLGQMQIYMGNKDAKKKFLKTLSISKKINKEVQKSKEFTRLYEETSDYLFFVKKQWEAKQELILNYIKDVLKLKIPNYTITVIITHPKLNNGNVISEKNKIISWGHLEDWKNYSNVYLTHEILHILTAKKYKNDKIMHAIIELSIDNELRIRLNKKGSYFHEKNKKIGHDYLQGIEKKILSHWRLYLEETNKTNIFEFEKKIIKKGLS